ncbi:hypothetical protein ACFGVS_03405 [Mucilaginibacter sp. AW1-7]|uniref:hypothetical protein n=1 Tax=Mucilaginibacter sp. AW1-7 TaxID=3349874 RepID=UPI003F739312
MMKMFFRSPLLYLIVFSIILVWIFSNHKKFTPLNFKDELPSKKTAQPILRINWLPTPVNIPDGKLTGNQEIFIKELKNDEIYVDTIKYNHTADLFISGTKPPLSTNYSYANFDGVTSYVQSELVPPSYENRAPLVIVDTTGWKPDYYTFSRHIDFNTIVIHSISGDMMRFRGDHALRLNLENIKLRLLQIVGSSFIKGPADLELYYDEPFNDAHDDLKTAPKDEGIKQVSIDNETVHTILSPYIKVLRLDSCVWADTTEIICDRAETIIFNQVKFKSPNGSVKLTNASPGATLLLRKVDFSKVDFDYSHFHYVPYAANAYKDQNEWYSDVVNIYQSIIASQTRLNNIEGIKASSIALAMFEDNNNWNARALIGVKIWWNNYGFEKGKVIASSLIVFCLFIVVNLLFMATFLEHYDVADIKKAWADTAAINNKTVKYGRRFILSALYTGIIFYGIKLDFDKMKTKRLDVVICLFVEFISGLIAIAYIASLIIVK